MQGLLRTVVLLLPLVVVLVAILFLVPTTGDSSRVIAVVRLTVRPSELLGVGLGVGVIAVTCLLLSSLLVSSY